MVERAWTKKALLLVVAAGAMGVVGSYQFLWSSIRPALVANLSMDEQALGSVFTLFIICQTLSQFPAGWVRDRYGPRPPLAVGAVLLVAGYLVTIVGHGLFGPLIALVATLGTPILLTGAVGVGIGHLRRRSGRTAVASPDGPVD